MRNHARMNRLFFALLAFCFLLEGISSATKKPPLKPININTANSEELQQVPGIGPATADKILQMRKSYGAFKSVDDLLSIRGIGKKRLEKMRRYLTVSKSASLTKPSCPGCTKPVASPSRVSPPSPPTESEDPRQGR
jgi:competence ComEA-like helix-hairpin-helix protein